MESSQRHNLSQGLAARARESLAGGVSSHYRFTGDGVPVFFEGGEGAWLRDVDGNEYIDYALGMGPTILGHAPRGVIERVKETLDQGQLYAGMHELEVELAEVMKRLVPSAELVRFGLSGSEVSQAALRVARARTGRDLIVKFNGMYHGWLDPIFVNRDPSAASGDFSSSPVGAGQPDLGSDLVAVLDWNDPAQFSEFFDTHGDRVAAVIMEAVSCNTGVIAPSPGYLETVRDLTRAHGSALIFDEVITGFRLALGGAQERLGVVPDLAIFAKAFGGGFPIAALVGSSDFMAPYVDGSAVHAGTYNSSVPTVAAALATLETLSADDGALLKAMESTGNTLLAGIQAAGAERGVDIHVQGFGTAFNTTFGVDGQLSSIGGYQSSNLDRQATFLRMLTERGVRPTSRGTWFVSAAHRDNEVDRTLEVVDDVLASL